MYHFVNMSTLITERLSKLRMLVECDSDFDFQTSQCQNSNQRLVKSQQQDRERG